MSDRALAATTVLREFHLTDTLVGLLTGLTFAAMYALASIPVARWADTGNRRRNHRSEHGDLELDDCCLWACAVHMAAFYFLAALLGGTVASPLLSIVSGLVRPEVRAVTLALMGLLPVLVGSGLGPVGVGALSDYLQNHLGVESLRYSLVISVLLMYWGAVHLYVASRHLLAEFEDLLNQIPERAID